MSLNFQRVLPDRKFRCKGGFTLVEVIIASFILVVVLSGLYIVLNIGDKINYEGSARVDLQSNIRQVLDLITQDVRQAMRTQLGDVANNPSIDHIRFNRVKGFDTGSTQPKYTTYSIDWSYDSTAEKLTRRIIDADDTTIETREFNNITESPFYTNDADGEIQPMASGFFLTSGVLIALITGQEQYRGRTLSLTLQELAKIRNE